MKEESTPLEDMQHKISELEKVQQQTFSVDRFKSRDSDFEFYTGFCNYSTFKASYDYLCPVCERLQYIGSYNTNSTTQTVARQKCGPKRLLSPDMPLLKFLSACLVMNYLSQSKLNVV